MCRLRRSQSLLRLMEESDVFDIHCSSMSCRWPPFVLSATVLLKSVMNSETLDVESQSCRKNQQEPEM